MPRHGGAGARGGPVPRRVHRRRAARRAVRGRARGTARAPREQQVRRRAAGRPRCRRRPDRGRLLRRVRPSRTPGAGGAVAARRVDPRDARRRGPHARVRPHRAGRLEVRLRVVERPGRRRGGAGTAARRRRRRAAGRCARAHREPDLPAGVLRGRGRDPRRLVRPARPRGAVHRRRPRRAVRGRRGGAVDRGLGARRWGPRAPGRGFRAGSA